MANLTKHQCGLCGTPLPDTNAACPNCLPDFYTLLNARRVNAPLGTMSEPLTSGNPVSGESPTRLIPSKNQTVLRFSSEGMVTKEAIGHFVLASDYDDLCEENRALRNLANNLRPGPISQALQESPDYSGQTIERLRAALEEAACVLDSEAPVAAQRARKALSGDSSAPETLPLDHSSAEHPVTGRRVMMEIDCPDFAIEGRWVVGHWCGADWWTGIPGRWIKIEDDWRILRWRPLPVETATRHCGCIPLAPRTGKYCQDCGGLIAQPGSYWYCPDCGKPHPQPRCNQSPLKTSDECLAHNSGCHVRDGSGICPLCKQPVGPVEKASYRPVCSKCQTPMRLAQTDYGTGWQLDCACKDGGPAKREPDNVDCGNPVMVNAEWYGPCTLPSGHDGDCKRTTKETVPRSDEGLRMPFQKTSPRTLNETERNAINRAADASVEVVDPDEITHGKDCQCGLCKHAHDL